MTDASPVQVRPYRSADRAVVSQIACETALCGQPIDPVFSDRALVAEALLGYYLDCEPDLTLIAEMDGQIVGYLTGCVDSRRSEQFLARRLAPRLLGRCLGRGHWVRGAFWRLAWIVGRSAARWSRVGPPIVERYPAHCHINLRPGFRRAGTGSALLTAFVSELQRRGMAGVHVVSATDPGKAFFSKSGFTIAARYPSPTLPGLRAREVWVMVQRLVPRAK